MQRAALPLVSRSFDETRPDLAQGAGELCRGGGVAAI